MTVKKENPQNKTRGSFFSVLYQKYLIKFNFYDIIGLFY